MVGPRWSFGKGNKKAGMAKKQVGETDGEKRARAVSSRRQYSVYFNFGQNYPAARNGGRIFPPSCRKGSQTHAYTTPFDRAAA